jgi:hypothetical protein
VFRLVRGEDIGMTKQEQFLWIVQTTVLANNIRLATEPAAIVPKQEQDRSVRIAGFSATATFGLCSDALDASNRIPEHMSVEDAARDWIFWMIENLRDADAKLPAWFARG